MGNNKDSKLFKRAATEAAKSPLQPVGEVAQRYLARVAGTAYPRAWWLMRASNVVSADNFSGRLNYAETENEQLDRIAVIANEWWVNHGSKL